MSNMSAIRSKKTLSFSMANVNNAHKVSINNLMMNDRNGGAEASHSDVQSGLMML
jgi:hypothetical protein